MRDCHDFGVTWAPRWFLAGSTIACNDQLRPRRQWRHRVRPFVFLMCTRQPNACRMQVGRFPGFQQLQRRCVLSRHRAPKRSLHLLLSRPDDDDDDDDAEDATPDAPVTSPPKRLTVSSSSDDDVNPTVDPLEDARNLNPSLDPENMVNALMR